MVNVTNAQLNSTVEQLKSLVNALTTRVATLERELKELKTPVSSPPPPPTHHPTTTQTASTWATRLFSSKSKPSEELQNVVSAVKIEMSENRKRHNNIMVFGLPPSAATTVEEKEIDDFARVEKILDKCGMQEIYKTYSIKRDETIVSVKRMKSKQNQANKPEPIVVKFDEGLELTNADFQDGRQWRKILSGAKSLRDSVWKGVFLAPDLTTLDREYGKRLRVERDRLNSALSEQAKAQFRYGVRGSQVVKILAKSS
jgi:hypothetical protein